jgi:hypothetical protein
MEALIPVATPRGPSMFTWIGELRSLSRHHAPEFNSKQKEPH